MVSFVSLQGGVWVPRKAGHLCNFAQKAIAKARPNACRFDHCGLRADCHPHRRVRKVPTSAFLNDSDLAVRPRSRQLNGRSANFSAHLPQCRHHPSRVGRESERRRMRPVGQDKLRTGKPNQRIRLARLHRQRDRHKARRTAWLNAHKNVTAVINTRSLNGGRRTPNRLPGPIKSGQRQRSIAARKRHPHLRYPKVAARHHRQLHPMNRAGVDHLNGTKLRARHCQNRSPLAQTPAIWRQRDPIAPLSAHRPTATALLIPSIDDLVDPSQRMGPPQLHAARPHLAIHPDAGGHLRLPNLRKQRQHRPPDVNDPSAA